MGLGLAAGRSAPGAPVDETYALVRQMLEDFTARFGSINCQELTGCALGSEEGQAAFLAKGQGETCTLYVEQAARFSAALVEHKSRPA
jgi:hypothetical protein